MTGHRRRSALGGLGAAALLLTGCTVGGPDPITAAPGSTAGSSVVGSVSAPPTTTRTSLVPVTPDGLLTGPGVDDTSIGLGVLVDPGVDRGFTAGVQLWQRTLNDSTGICGRKVELVTDPLAWPAAATAGYRDLVPRTLGLITLPSTDTDNALSGEVTHDRIPAVTPTGRSTDLDPWGPMIVGATDDILAINGAAHLLQTGVLDAGGVLGVASDSSLSALDAEAGLRWFAESAGVTLQVRDVQGSAAAWPGVAAVIAVGGPELTGAVLAASTVPVVTLLGGYDPASFQPAWAGRLLVLTPTTAPNSDHPGAKAVAKAYADAGGTAPGPLLFAGYAAGATWGRLLEQACTAGDLTRTGVRTAAENLGPASPDTLLGATDLAVLVRSGRPATRSSAVSTADPSMPGGLAAVTWLASAPGIGDYQRRK